MNVKYIDVDVGGGCCGDVAIGGGSLADLAGDHPASAFPYTRNMTIDL